MLHTMTFMEKMNIIIIYGGRNMSKECFLFDMYILNLDSLQWAEVNVHGKAADRGRCAHAAVGY